MSSISPVLQSKFSCEAPATLDVEKFLIEIAKKYEVKYEPGREIITEKEASPSSTLVENGGHNACGPSTGFISQPSPVSGPFTEVRFYASNLK